MPFEKILGSKKAAFSSKPRPAKFSDDASLSAVLLFESFSDTSGILVADSFDTAL